MHVTKTNDLAPQQITVDVIQEKYLKDNERTEMDIFRRTAKHLASVEKEEAREFWESAFLQNMINGAIGAGRIMSSAGTDIQATLINCFVQPVGDAIQGVDSDGLPGIYEALRECAETMRRGGGVGYDFTPIRPRGAHVKGTHSSASGPCSYMDVFDKSCETVESAGARRGAQMGALRIDHPDVLEFITAKRTPGRWNNFNVSVGVTDAFVQAVLDGATWELVHKAKPGLTLISEGAYLRSDGKWVYRKVNARDLWDTIMKSAYDFAEPGILFLDRINTDNNLRYCEKIGTTNPCGEQPLPAYGCCDLGPLILTKFVQNPFGFNGIPSFDFDGFKRAVTVQVRMLDNVLDATYWPLEQQREESHSKRRIGVGFTGMGNALAMLQIRYDTAEGRETARRIAEAMRDSAYQASIDLAQEKGPFPLLVVEEYLAEGTFASRLPDSIKTQLRCYGIRNSHLLSIAPTGTVSLAFADNASNGIEPPFSWTYQRKKRAGDSKVEYTVEDHAWRLFRHLGGDVNNLPDYFVTAQGMDVDGHVGMMQAVQPYIDTSISKTVNVPADYSFEKFKELYLKAWKAGLKGMATYRPNDILGSVLSVSSTPEAKEPDPVDYTKTVIENRPKGALNAMSDKIEYFTPSGRKRLYLVVSFLQMPDGSERAIEFFMPVGQNGDSQQWITSSMRLLSLAARGGFLDRTLEEMRKVPWDQGPIRFGAFTKPDGTKVPMFHDSEVAVIAYAIQQLIAKRKEGVSEEISTPEQSEETAPQKNQILAGRKCEQCGANAMIKKDGCMFCTNCGEVGSCG